MTALTTGRILGTSAVRATITKRVVADGTITRAPDHDAAGVAEVWVDMQAIVKLLAEKALRAKGGKAQVLRGAIVVKIVDRVKTREYP
jgi:hypothetical protein